MLENLGFLLLGMALGIGGLVLWQAVDYWRNAAGPADSDDWIKQSAQYQNVENRMALEREIKRAMKGGENA